MARKKKFERRIIRTRNRLEKRGQKMALNAIKKQYKAVFDLVGIYSPEQLLHAIDKVVTSDSIMEFFMNYYPMFAEIGVLYRKDMISQKATEDTMYESLFIEQLRSYGLTQAQIKLVKMTHTSQVDIIDAVEKAIAEASVEGLGIDKTARIIKDRLEDSLGTIGKSRARTIAQTEMISASNQSAIYGADSTGLEYRKFWSTSGLPNIRDSHLFAEENHPNGIMKDQTFNMGDGTRMLQPGDPEGGPKNVINCRCTVLIEVI